MEKMISTLWLWRFCTLHGPRHVGATTAHIDISIMT